MRLVARSACICGRCVFEMIHTGDSSIKPSHTALLQPASVPGRLPEGDLADSFELVIRPQSGWIGIDWKEMLAHRELLFFLIWRDISVRYKQTVLGRAWAILQPLMLMLIFTFVFGRLPRSIPTAFPTRCSYSQD